MRLRFLATAFAAFFFVNGLALGIVGLAALPASTPGALAALLIAGALVTYAIRLALGARRGRVPDWIKDLPPSAPL